MEPPQLEIDALKNETIDLITNPFEKYKRLKARCESLEKELEDCRNEIITLKAELKLKNSRYKEGYELFKSFVETGKEEVILLDTAYEILYINKSACEALGIGDVESLIGTRIFEYFSFKDGVKLKEKIDKAFLKGDARKAKKIYFQKSNLKKVKLKLKIVRVRFKNRPSIKMVIK